MEICTGVENDLCYLQCYGEGGWGNGEGVKEEGGNGKGGKARTRYKNLP